MSKRKLYPDPRTDVIFKTIFGQGSVESTIARNSLIEAFIGKKVKSSTILYNDLPVTNEDEKAISMDLHCILDDKTRVNIEMQFAKMTDSIEARLSHYLMRLALQQQLKGKSYAESHAAYVILISDKTLYKDSEHLAHFRMTSKKGREICPELNIVIIELQKLREKGILKEDLNLAEKWGLFFSYAHDKSKGNVLQPILENEEGIQMANQILETLTPEEIESSVEFLRWQREYKRAVIVEEGRKQGLAEGLERGIEQGREEGLEQGKIQTARNMKAGGISAKQIKEFTGLAEGEY